MDDHRITHLDVGGLGDRNHGRDTTVQGRRFFIRDLIGELQDARAR